MKKPILLSDLLAHDDDTKELYVSDNLKRKYRAKKGQYSKTKGTFDFIHLVKSWEQVVGALMAKNTLPLRIRGNTLFVISKHAVFSQELAMLSPQIIQKIEEHFPALEGKIKKIKFLTSEFSSDEFVKSEPKRAPPVSKREFHQFSPHFLAKKAKAEKEFEDVDDPELKEILVKLYIGMKNN